MVSYKSQNVTKIIMSIFLTIFCLDHCMYVSLIKVSLEKKEKITIQEC